MASAIFYQNDEEKTIAEEVIKIVNDSKKWDAGTVVTTLEPFAPFWQAEPEHQDYLVKKSSTVTLCHYLRFEESFI